MTKICHRINKKTITIKELLEIIEKENIKPENAYIETEIVEELVNKKFIPTTQLYLWIK